MKAKSFSPSSGSTNHFGDGCEAFVVRVCKMISLFDWVSDSRFGSWLSEVVGYPTRRLEVLHEKIIVDLSSNKVFG
jgi:hypothetical protein